MKKANIITTSFPGSPILTPPGASALASALALARAFSQAREKALGTRLALSPQGGGKMRDPGNEVDSNIKKGVK